MLNVIYQKLFAKRQFKPNFKRRVTLCIVTFGQCLALGPFFKKRIYTFFLVSRWHTPHPPLGWHHLWTAPYYNEPPSLWATYMYVFTPPSQVCLHLKCAGPLHKFPLMDKNKRHYKYVPSLGGHVKKKKSANTTHTYSYPRYGIMYWLHAPLVPGHEVTSQTHDHSYYTHINYTKLYV